MESAVAAFTAYLGARPDPADLVRKIDELGRYGNPQVADALKPLLRHKSDEVKIAVARTIGKQGDPKVARLLVAIADFKEMDENPRLLAALLEGIGDADARRNYKYLLKIGKKYMDRNGEIACSAFRACAHHVTRETVDDLIQALRVATYVTTNDRPEKRESRAACTLVLLDLLNQITGEEINDVKVWHEWWSDNKRTWKPPVSTEDREAALNEAGEFTDSAYGFSIGKPNRAWMFRLNEVSQPFLTIEALEEGQRAAWLELTVVPTKVYKSKTSEAWAAEMRRGLEGRFRDIKEADWERKARLAGRDAVEQVVWGMHRDYDAVKMRNLYLERDGVMFQFVTFWKAGGSPSLMDDLDAILASFRLTR